MLQVIISLIVGFTGLTTLSLTSFFAYKILKYKLNNHRKKGNPITYQEFLALNKPYKLVIKQFQSHKEVIEL